MVGLSLPLKKKKSKPCKKLENGDPRTNSLFYKAGIIPHTELVFLSYTYKSSETAFSPVNSSTKLSFSSMVVLVQEGKDSPLDMRPEV